MIIRSNTCTCYKYKLLGGGATLPSYGRRYRLSPSAERELIGWLDVQEQPRNHQGTVKRKKSLQPTTWTKKKPSGGFAMTQWHIARQITFAFLVPANQLHYCVYSTVVI